MRRADIKLGYSCNNACLHCVIDDFRDVVLASGRPEDLSTETYARELRESRSRGAQRGVFTGGEPSIRKDLLELLAVARDLGLGIDMQSNGRRFADLEFASAMMAAAPVGFCIALHGNGPELHDRITQRPGSFDQTVAGIRNLVSLGASVGGKLVLQKLNSRVLPETVKLFIDLGVDNVCITFPHACGSARKLFDQVVPRYADVQGAVLRSIELCARSRVSVDTEAIPLCLLPGCERFASELGFLMDDDTELKQYGKDDVIDWAEERPKIKQKFPQCRHCRYDPVCEGPWREYPEAYGSREFVPVPGERVHTLEELMSPAGPLKTM